MLRLVYVESRIKNQEIAPISCKIKLLTYRMHCLKRDPVDTLSHVVTFNVYLVHPQHICNLPGSSCTCKM